MMLFFLVVNQYKECINDVNDESYEPGKSIKCMIIKYS